MITLITPTRDRSKPFGLLEGFITRQTYKGPLQWLVVNDGDEPYKYNCGQTAIIRSRAFDAEDITSICYNYRAALPLVQGSKILCIEDDDYYAPDYIQVMADALDEADLVGLSPAFYYHVCARKWRNLKNFSHASLAATGFTDAVLPVFDQATRMKNTVYLDCWLFPHWRDTLLRSAKLIEQNEKKPLQVGMKGLPWGCRGLGLGHDPVPGTSDPHYHKLKTWLGQDWSNYQWPSKSNKS